MTSLGQAKNFKFALTIYLSNIIMKNVILTVSLLLFISVSAQAKKFYILNGI